MALISLIECTRMTFSSVPMWRIVKSQGVIIGVVKQAEFFTFGYIYLCKYLFFRHSVNKFFRNITLQRTRVFESGYMHTYFMHIPPIPYLLIKVLEGLLLSTIFSFLIILLALSEVPGMYGVEMYLIRSM